MNDQNHRSAAEVMANAARVVKAAVNIVRAAIAGGLHGAAAAAAKELLPTIIKFAVGVLIAIIVIPMFVISANAADETAKISAGRVGEARLRRAVAACRTTAKDVCLFFV